MLGFLLAVALVNGSGAQAATTPCADLVATAVTASPASPAAGQPANVLITVRNNGTCAAGAFAVSWRPSLFGVSQPPVSVSGGLAAGAATTVTVPYTFPQAGVAVTVATVDPANAVAETNEGNNSSTGVIVVAPPVDLVVSALTIGTGGAVAGFPTAASISVTNTGTAAAGGFRVDWSPGDGGAVQSRTVAGLGAGATTTLTIPYTFAKSGTFGTIANVDAGNTVAESNELNNTKLTVATVLPALPDLVVTSAPTSPNPAFAGSDVVATITVANQGFVPAGPFTVSWWPWLAAAPVTTQVSGLAPGASTTVNLDSVFAFTGQFDGTVTVDSTSAVSEINELNNTFATHVTGITPTLNAQKVASNGIDNDPANNYSWSMAWFNGKLYVGTARSNYCVQEATLDFYYPGQGYYRGILDGLPEANCPPDPYDMDLRAEIWQYTPETNVWKRVYQSPTVTNPRAPSKQVALDIGYRGMIVHDGALYVAGVSADEYIPELAASNPPRILRSTDGENFAPLPHGPGTINTVFGPQRPIGFRSFASFQGRLFVTASGGLTGDGVVLEITDPGGPNQQFVQVTPNTYHVYELEPFNNSLYLGSVTPNHGYTVLKVTDPSTTPFTVQQIVPEGAGRGAAITSVVSMHVYKGRLYVGANGWGGGQADLASEEIRINPDDTWDLVVGQPRTLADGTTKTPISGLGNGFGNFWTAHMWRAETHNGAMYIGTNDASSAWKDPRLQPLPTVLAPEFGFDVWGTCDGQYWWRVTRDAFGDGAWNFGARTMVSTPFGLFIGSTNHVEGTSIWKGDASPCGSGGGGQFAPFQRVASPGSPAASAPEAAATRVWVAPPHRLLAERQPCGTALAWDVAPAATRYRILRADYRAMEVKLSPSRLAQVSPDLIPGPAGGGGGLTKTHRVWTLGPYTSIGTTTDTSFVDRTAKRGGRYSYEVVALDAAGRTSQPSNVAAMPSETSAATFSELNVAVGRLVDSARANRGANTSDAGTTALLRLAATARASWRQTGPSASLAVLERLRAAAHTQAAHVGKPAATVASGDLDDAIFQLERRAQLRTACR